MSQGDKNRFFKEICSNSAREKNRYRGREVAERQMVYELTQRYTTVVLCCMLNLTRTKPFTFLMSEAFKPLKISSVSIVQLMT